MTAAAPPVASGVRVPVARTRISFSFAPDGTSAACLTSDGRSPLVLEQWVFTGSTVDRQLLSSPRGDSAWTQLLCLADGMVLRTRPGAGIHRLVLAEPTATGLAERNLVAIECPGLRLIDTPDPDTYAIAIGNTGGDRSVLWRILPSEPWQERIAEVSGLLGGGYWLDTVGNRVAFNRRLDGVTRPIAVDLRDGSAEPLPGTAPDQHVLLTAPQSGLLALAAPIEGSLRFAHGRIDGSRRPHFPDHLHAVKGSATPMAVDPSGSHVALRVDRGARSHLLIYTPAQERVREIAIPPGVIGATGGWTEHGLRFPFSTPTRPTGIATVTGGLAQSDAPIGWGFATDDDDDPGWVDARICEFDGPTGSIEAVVYGRGDWRDARQLVVALHGGPEAATRIDFDPLMQTLAGSGIAVIAPNYRGSVGYGLPHQQALHGAWGGPDLADVRHLARELTRQRRTPGPLMVFGVSYGAFLALLAASADPEYWSHCVAIAPFVSAPRLYEDGSPGVRALLDRLGGRTAIDDELGPRDLARLCGQITARLLVMHGANDDVIPVGQSRQLRQHLLAAGRREGGDFLYLEPVAGGHYPIGGSEGAELTRCVVEFLLGARS